MIDHELQHSRWLLGQKAPFEAVLGSLNQFLMRPGIDEFRLEAESWRVRVYAVYERPIEECAAVLETYLAMETDLLERAHAAESMCITHPGLAPRFLHPIVAELETVIRHSATPEGIHAAKKESSAARQTALSSLHTALQIMTDILGALITKHRLRSAQVKQSMVDFDVEIDTLRSSLPKVDIIDRNRRIKQTFHRLRTFQPRPRVGRTSHPGQ